jgi:hypothetical protein
MSPVKERPAPAHTAEAPEGKSFEVERAHMLALAGELMQVPSEESRPVAEVLRTKVAALPGHWPREKVHALVRHLLDDPGLTDHRAARSAHLRRELVGVLFRLGFPWALEITPEELRLLKGTADEENPEPPGYKAGIITFLMAMVSLPWNLFVTLVSGLMMAEHTTWHSFSFFALAALGSIHSVLVMIATAGDKPQEKRAARLRWLAKWAVWGPVAAVAVVSDAGWRWKLAFSGLFIAGPSLLVSLLCAVCAWSILRPAPSGKM